MARILNNRYALKDSPVAGGLADVYEAADTHADFAHVAVKIIRVTPDHEGLLPVFFDREVSALRALSHPNIVRLLDAGREDGSGQYFLVLEWMPSDLVRFLESRRPLGWDDFIEEIGLGLLSGLAHAHQRAIVHRDVKPSNVLLDAQAIPKLADFGISKIKSQLAGHSQTVADFASRPYAPPERDSTSNYNRDVFGFGVLILSCVTDVDLRDYPDIQTAIDRLDAPPHIISIIERSVSFDPSLRPPNAQVLLAEVEAVQRSRRRVWKVTPSVHLILGKGAAAKIVSSDGKTVAGAAEKVVAADLEKGAHVERRSEGSVDRPKLSDASFWIYGESWRYMGTLQAVPPSIALVSAKNLSPGQLDVAREHSWSTHFRFALGAPLNHELARDSLRLFLEQLDEFHERRDQERAKRESERLFGQWRNQLLAKEAVEYSREEPLKFVAANVHGRRVTFDLVAAPEEDLVGQRRAVKQTQGGAARIRGEVEKIAEAQITLYVDRDIETVVQKGELILDTHESLVALERQRMALDAVRFGSSLVERDDLRGFILDPSTSNPPIQSEPVQWYQADLDDDKKEAVRAALGSPDFLVV